MPTSSQSPATGGNLPQVGLGSTLATLAGTPDDASEIDVHLLTIVGLVADLVEAVSYASVTAFRAGAPTTVAASSEVAHAVDLAQYRDGSGPCVDAAADGKPVDVPDVAAVMSWPGFRDEAWRLGLRASLSIPLFAASGVPVAALNLYAHDPGPMAALTRRVWALYDSGGPAVGAPALQVDAGGEQLLAGIAAAFKVRDVIQRALGLVMERDHVTSDAAYRLLRMKADSTGATLVTIAAETANGDCA